MRGRVGFGATIRDVLWEAQDGMCWICGQGMLRKASNAPLSVSLDHIWPKSLSGELGDIGITLLAHRNCNAVRGNPPPTDDDIRALVAVWRKVDARWLRWNRQQLEAELRTLQLRRQRVNLLKMLEAA